MKAKAFAKNVFIKSRTKVGGSTTIRYRRRPAGQRQGNHESLGSRGSMVAKLKLKGIDGRAPPGVKPAA